MFESRCVKIRLKPGSMERVREWAMTLNERRDEALATLRDESGVVESIFLDQTEDGDFLIYYMKAESFGKSAQAYKNSTHAIDEYHRRFIRETRAEAQRLELLVDLDRILEVSESDK
jgi:Family of unknown function (DUF6176)